MPPSTPRRTSSACWWRRRARKLEAKPDEIECLGELYRAGAQDKGLTFNEVVTEALRDTGTITVTGNYSTIPNRTAARNIAAPRSAAPWATAIRRRWWR